MCECGSIRGMAQRAEYRSRERLSASWEMRTVECGVRYEKLTPPSRDRGRVGACLTEGRKELQTRDDGRRNDVQQSGNFDACLTRERANEMSESPPGRTPGIRLLARPVLYGVLVREASERGPSGWVASSDGLGFLPRTWATPNRRAARFRAVRPSPGPGPGRNRHLLPSKSGLRSFSLSIMGPRLPRRGPLFFQKSENRGQRVRKKKGRVP